jgi:uncharacterized protein (DUF608 family)
MWPRIQKAIAFAWQPGGWDADKDGVMEGVQHNTYDVEFYGPNPQCGIYYLGALRACEEMARHLGDAVASTEYRYLFERGSAWIDANLFNGEYYIQKVRGVPKEEIAPALRSSMGSEDTMTPEYQLGEGCLTDQLVGQYLADVAGLGPLVREDNIRKTLASILKYNYKRSLEEHDSVQRTYALNDEAALLICSYGKAERPRIPFPYYAEAWTGFEYMFGSQLMYAGMTPEGSQIFESARLRHDGERRNAWDEPECGHHYARAMSAWSGIAALSGFLYRGANRRLILQRRSGAGRWFWATGTGWGTLSRTAAGRITIDVIHGSLACDQIDAGRPLKSVSMDGKPVALPVECRAGSSLVIL